MVVVRRRQRNMATLTRRILRKCIEFSQDILGKGGDTLTQSNQIIHSKRTIKQARITSCLTFDELMGDWSNFSTFKSLGEKKRKKKDMTIAFRF